MPISVSHVLTATGSDNTKYEIRPSHWNSGHAIVLNLSGTDISGAFGNSNNVSFGTNIFGAVTGSASFSQSVQTQGSVQVNGSTGSIVFANSNGVTFGGNASTITASFAGGGGGAAISAAGNSQNTGTVVFSNSNNVTFGMAGSVITASVPAAGGAQTGISGIVVSNTTYTSGTVSFSNANGISFGSSAGQAITASYTVPTQTAYVFSYSNGISFGTNGSTVTASYTVPTQSVQTQASGAIAGTNWTTTSTAGSQLTGTMNSSGLTLAVPSWLTTYVSGNTANSFYFQGNTTNSSSGTMAQSSQNLSVAGAMTGGWSASSMVLSVPATSLISGTGLVSVATAGSTISIGVPALSVSAGAGTSNTLSAITFQNSNGITFGLSTGAGVGSMTASYNSTQFAGQGTTITGNASITLGSAGMSFNGSGLAGTTTAITGNASITLNSSGLNFNGSGLAGTNTASSGGNFAWTLNSSGLSINGSNIAGTTTAVTGRASITLNSAGLNFNGVSLAGVGTGTAITGNAQITLSANSSSIALSFNGSGLAGTGFTTGTTTGAWTATLNTNGLSEVMPYRTRYLYPDGMGLTTIGQPGNASMTFQYVDLQMPVTGTRMDALASMSYSTSAGAGTQTYQFSQYAIIYTKNASTLSSLSSGSTQTTYTLASNTAGQTQFTQAAIRPISVPINFNMPPGEYYVGFNMVTANTAGSATFSMMGGAMATGMNFAEMASQTATSTNVVGGMGVWSAATTGVLNAAGGASLSGINQTGTALAQANIAILFRNA